MRFEHFPDVRRLLVFSEYGGGADGTEAAVAFELLLVVPLVGGALLRELDVVETVLAHVDGRAGRAVRLHDDEHACALVLLEPDRSRVRLGIPNRSGDEMCAGGIGEHRVDVEIDLGAEVDARLSNCVTEIGEGGARISAAIGVDDVAAAALDQ